MKQQKMGVSNVNDGSRCAYSVEDVSDLAGINLQLKRTVVWLGVGVATLVLKICAIDNCICR